MYLMPLVERLGRRRLNSLGLESRFAESPAGVIHYYESRSPGVLPPIVVLHGFGASATSFGPVLARLRHQSRRLVAPEAPGHGFSRGVRGDLTVHGAFEAVTDFLVRTIDEPALLFGNSLGGAMAIRFAAAHPERVRGLVLSSPAGAPMADDEFAEVVRSFRVGNLGEGAALLRRLYHQAPWFAPLLAADLLRHFREPALRGLLDSFSPADLLTPAELAALSAPTLLLWGRSERLLPNAGLDFFRRHLPSHAAIEEPEDFGHCPNLDRPRQLAERITAFARTL
ncbi:MAG TPA: alpha/beta fold hydrolase [Nannocystaceae bacterium]|nr:alpha/beta fold hydrolase [Nannocystaceae bacterium]